MHSSRRLLLRGVIVAAVPSLAFAHPGHDGHEVTWDLSHLAAHPLATIGCVLVIAGGGWIAWRLARRASGTARSRQDSSREG